MRKKILTLTLALSMCMVGLTACGGDKSSDDETTAASNETVADTEADADVEEAEATEEETTEAEPAKEVQTYTVTSKDETGEMTFDFVKDDKYTQADAMVSGIEITDSSNYSVIEARLYHDSVFSSTITKEEDDFYADKYHDYKQVTYGSYSGWEVYTESSEYEISLVLNDKDADNKVYAADFKVIKSNMMDDGMEFDINEFVASEDFQNLLNSIQLTKSE